MEKLFPDCSYCPMNATNPETFCSGHCRFDFMRGKCELKGKHCLYNFYCNLDTKWYCVCKNSSLYISDEFTKKENSFCSISSTYGSYEHLLSAKIACASETRCIGIQETYNDDQNIEFRLCRHKFITSYSHTSVIHHRGMHISRQRFSGTYWLCRTNTYFQNYKCTRIEKVFAILSYILQELKQSALTLH